MDRAEIVELVNGKCPKCPPTKKTELKKGDFVKIYQKPITREDYEGVGRIIRVDSDQRDDGASVCVQVAFRGETGRFPRFVYEPIEVVAEF